MTTLVHEDGATNPTTKVDMMKTTQISRTEKQVVSRETRTQYWQGCPNGPTFAEVAEAKDTVDTLCIDPVWADLFRGSRVRELGFQDHAILTWATWIARECGICVLRSLRLLLIARDGEHMARLVEGGAA